VANYTVCELSSSTLTLGRFSSSLTATRSIYVTYVGRRVGHGSGRPAGRVGSKFLIWIIFLSASVEFRKFNSPFTSRNVLLCERWRPVWILSFCGLSSWSCNGKC